MKHFKIDGTLVKPLFVSLYLNITIVRIDIKIITIIDSTTRKYQRLALCFTNFGEF